MPQHETPPSLPRQALSLMTAAAKFALGGGRVVSAEEHESRMAACNECPAKRGDQCTACGCVLSIKSWMPGEFCPKGRWPT